MADRQLLALERSPTLASRARGTVKEAIISGELAPDSHQSEADLARTLGISRAPLREALRQLGEEGLVQADSRGVRVAPLTQQTVSDLYQVRLALEGQAAVLAFDRVPRDEVEAMRERMKELGDALESGSATPFIAADIAFHDLWVKNCNNRMLEQYIGRLRDHIRRASNFASGLTQASYEAYLEHLKILEALDGNSAKAFRAAVEMHISSTSERILTAFPEDGAASDERSAPFRGTSAESS